MEKDNNEKDNNRKVIAFSLFLALICISILGLIIYFKINKKEEPIKQEPKIEEEEAEPREEEKEEPEEKKEEIDDELINSLYSIIGSNPELRYTELVNYESLSENVRDEIVLNSLNTVCQETNVYNKELFLVKYKEIFNQEKTSDDGLCQLNGTDYECSRYCNEFGDKIFSVLKSSEIVEDSLIIYEEAGHLDYADDGKIYLKENAIDTTAIASFDEVDELKNSEIQYKLPTYKHTFNKNEDGTYYWVSSESVKQ